MSSDETVPTYYSSDEEMIKDRGDEVDPFRHKIKMTKAQWAVTYVLGVILIPLRLIVVLLIVMLASITARITLIGDALFNYCIHGKYFRILESAPPFFIN